MTCEEDTIPACPRGFQQLAAEHNDLGSSTNLRDYTLLHVVDDDGAACWRADIRELIRDRESIGFCHSPPSLHLAKRAIVRRIQVDLVAEERFNWQRHLQSDETPFQQTGLT